MKKISLGFLITLSMGALSAQNFIESAPEQHSSKTKWIRRATLVAACGASLAFDALTTRRAIANGAVESNGLLAGSNGSVSWGRVIGLKAGVCGASTIMQETHLFGQWNSPKADWTWTIGNLGIASIYTSAGFHNLSLAAPAPSK